MTEAAVDMDNVQRRVTRKPKERKKERKKKKKHIIIGWALIRLFGGDFYFWRLS